jgi:hypothetical protein
MANITNNHGLPQAVMNALHRPTYDKGRSQISVTQAINSPRIVALRQIHDKSISIDATQLVWSLFGTAVHHILEQGADEKHLTEERIFTEIEGWIFSGAIDSQICHADGTRTIQDYKVTKAWSVMNEKREWEQQLNIYRWLVETVKKTPVKSIQIVAIIRDWSMHEAKREGYPQAPIVTLDVPMWDNETTEQFIRERIRLHQEAFTSSAFGDELVPCTPEDMWVKPPVYAVKNDKRVKAIKLYTDKHEAEAHVQVLGKGHFVEHRPEERTRCANFCDVKDFCNQWRSYEASLSSAD